MRDMLMFVLCCLVGGAYFMRSHDRQEFRERARQDELYGLGAPQTMDPSPERSLLLGEFERGLRATPDSDTYDKLAELYLVSANLEGRKVVASAFNASLMARVLGTAVQIFDVEGRPLTPKLWTLGDRAVSPQREPFQAAASATIVASGPWLLYEDSKRWAVFRQEDDTLSGFISAAQLTVDGDTVEVKEGRKWRWSGGKLEIVAES